MAKFLSRLHCVNSLRPSDAYICISDLNNIGSDNGLSPARRQAIIWTNAGILLTGPIGTKFSEILIEIHTSSLKKMHWKMASGKWRLFRLGLSVLMFTCDFCCWCWRVMRLSYGVSGGWRLDGSGSSGGRRWYCRLLRNWKWHFRGILPKGPYLPCVSMAGRALLAGYPRFI